MLVGLASLQEPEQSSVTLAAYARHIQACECAFFGVVNAPACGQAALESLTERPI